MIALGFSLLVVALLFFVKLSTTRIFTATLVFEKITAADRLLLRYEGAYAGAVSLTADNLWISDVSVELSLIRLSTIIESKRELLEDCKQVSETEMLRPEVSGAVLHELNKNFFQNEMPKWEAAVDSMLETIVRYFFSQQLDSISLATLHFDAMRNPMYAGLIPYFESESNFSNFDLPEESKKLENSRNVRRYLKLA